MFGCWLCSSLCLLGERPRRVAKKPRGNLQKRLQTGFGGLQVALESMVLVELCSVQCFLRAATVMEHKVLGLSCVGVPSPWLLEVGLCGLQSWLDGQLAQGNALRV